MSDVKDVVVPVTAFDRTHSWFVYVIRVGAGKRDFLMQKLLDSGIQVRPYLPVIHLQPFMKEQFGYKKGDFPVAERVASETLALPFYIGMTVEDVKYISDKIRKFLND